MTTVYDVAKYILDKYGAMSAMKLQKLLFYCQAMSLVWDDVPLFDEEFEAWRDGPVCRNLFALHKGMYILHNDSFLNGLGNTSILADNQKETVDTVVQSLIDLPPYRLSQLTHSESPWRDARGNLQAHVKGTKIISKDSMRDYYATHW